jgi:hypothetical protein
VYVRADRLSLTSVSYLGQGGGVFISGGDTDFSGCTINSNTAGSGAGIMEITNDERVIYSSFRWMKNDLAAEASLSGTHR